MQLTRYKAKCVKTCCLQEGVGHLEPRSQGKGSSPANILIPLERQLNALQCCRWQFLYNEGVVPGEYFFGFYKTRHILLSDSTNCTVLRAVVLTQYRRVTDRQTDGQTDGIAVANTALAMPALRRAIKIGFKNATNELRSLTLPGPNGGAYKRTESAFRKKS